MTAEQLHHRRGSSHGAERPCTPRPVEPAWLVQRDGDGPVAPEAILALASLLLAIDPEIERGEQAVKKQKANPLTAA